MKRDILSLKVHLISLWKRERVCVCVRWSACARERGCALWSERVCVCVRGAKINWTAATVGVVLGEDREIERSMICQVWGQRDPSMCSPAPHLTWKKHWVAMTIDRTSNWSTDNISTFLYLVTSIGLNLLAWILRVLVLHGASLHLIELLTFSLTVHTINISH